MLTSKNWSFIVRAVAEPSTLGYCCHWDQADKMMGIARV